MTALLQQIPLDRALLIIFLAGRLYEGFRATRVSQRSQGERLGALETKVAALEASRTRV